MKKGDGSSPSSQPNLINLSEAVVVFPPGLSGPDEKAVTMLVEEVERRARIRWESATTWPSRAVPVIAVGPASALAAFAGEYANKLSADEQARAAEGYRIRIENGKDSPVVFVVGNDSRGVLFGVGHLLRTLRMKQGKIALPDDLNVTTAPHYRLRGHQLGYRDKTNSYCGWDLPQWEQYIRDLVVFGTNAIELIPPRSDDKLDSVHFPLPSMEMMVGMSQLADDYGVDLWIWFPAMDEDYSDPATVEFALDEWGEVFEKLLRIDAVFVPGGDPGRTQPKHLMSLLKKQTELLKSFHPQAEMWVSPQGFTQEWMDEFMGILEGESPDWLAGVVHGPWVHMPMTEFRRLIPDKYPIRNYPDITHSLSCQFPVPDWDVAFALTEGREVINPRPLDQAAIFRHSQPPTIGFLTYSEGCNDDVNKCVWSGLGWDPDRKVVDILREYSRYFIGERYTDDFAKGLLALERNWQGPLACNAGVYTTLQQFQAMEESASPHDLKNWRFQQALYRAYYDAYTRSRLLFESGLEEQAMDQLRRAPEKGSLVALAEAERTLDLAVNQRISNSWRTRIFQLAEALFQIIHMQLSVRLYCGQEEVRGANLDGIDFPLNNRPWLKGRFTEIREMADEAGRLEGIKAILRWTNPGPGGFFDDLSNSFQQLHLVKGPGFEEDPSFLESPLRKFPYRKEPQALRASWRSYTGSLNDASFEMHYPDLDPNAQYKVRIVYSTVSPHIKVRLEANDGIEVHPLIFKQVPHGPVEFDVPKEATQGGELTLRWYREQGQGGSGTGCEVSELWLIKV
jgi:hypothetical protein